MQILDQYFTKTNYNMIKINNLWINIKIAHFQLFKKYELFYTLIKSNHLIKFVLYSIWILDPFAGSSTTGIAANLANRRYLGIDMETEFLEMSKNRKLEIENPIMAAHYRQKINGFNDKKELSLFLAQEPNEDYSPDLDCS